MTETYDKLNHWYGWNGGECPVHPETVVEIGTGSEQLEDRADEFSWSHDGDSGDIIAFRITKLHVEPKVIWVNEYANHVAASPTQDDAFQLAGKNAIRVAVRYVEQPL